MHSRRCASLLKINFKSTPAKNILRLYRGLLRVRYTNDKIKSFGDRAFSRYGPRIWNDNNEMVSKMITEYKFSKTADNEYDKDKAVMLMNGYEGKYV